MEKTVYGLLCSRLTFPGGVRDTYGIALCEQSAGECVILASAVDLTCDRAVAERLVETCNRLDLSPVHFREVIEDFLAR